MLRHFQIPYLEKEGYANIRCAWSLGCPAEIKPLDEEGEHRAAVHAGGDYKKAFEILFPEKEVPKHVGVSCCAQFAATKEKILERPKKDYEHYRKWLINTPLEDSISGRILEYSWHSKLSFPIVPSFPLRGVAELSCPLLTPEHWAIQLSLTTWPYGSDLPNDISSFPGLGHMLTCDSGICKRACTLPVRQGLLLQRVRHMQSRMRRRGQLCRTIHTPALRKPARGMAFCGLEGRGAEQVCT